MSDGTALAPVRPAIWVNCAASVDGKLAFAGGRRARLSSPEDLVRVQRLRANADAILVGVGTVILDDPSLRVHWEMLGEPAGKDPTRVVVDASGRTPSDARILDSTAPTLVGTSHQNTRSYPAHVGVIVAGDTTVDLPELFAALPQRGIRRLLVEGGAAILSSVLRAGLFDRFTVYYAPLVIGGTTAPSLVRGPETERLEDALPLELAGVERMGEGHVATYLPHRGAHPRTGAEALEPAGSYPIRFLI